MFDHHVRARGCASHVFEVLAHQAVATPRVGRVDHAHLLITVASREAGLLAKEQVLLALVAEDVLRPQQLKQFVHSYDKVGLVHKAARAVKLVARVLERNRLAIGAVGVVNSPCGDLAEVRVHVQVVVLD